MCSFLVFFRNSTSPDHASPARQKARTSPRVAEHATTNSMMIRGNFALNSVLNFLIVMLHFHPFPKASPLASFMNTPWHLYWQPLAPHTETNDRRQYKTAHRMTSSYCFCIACQPMGQKFQPSRLSWRSCFPNSTHDAALSA